MQNYSVEFQAHRLKTLWNLFLENLFLEFQDSLANEGQSFRNIALRDFQKSFNWMEFAEMSLHSPYTPWRMRSVRILREFGYARKEEISLYDAKMVVDSYLSGNFQSYKEFTAVKIVHRTGTKVFFLFENSLLIGKFANDIFEMLPCKQSLITDENFCKAVEVILP